MLLSLINIGCDRKIRMIFIKLFGMFTFYIE